MKSKCAPAPASADALTAKAQALAADDVDLQDFTLQDALDKVWGVSTAPIAVD